MKNMTEEKVYNLINEEINSKTLSVTEQYLGVNSLVYDDGKLKIERIDREKQGFVIAYLPVKEERYYISFYLDILTEEIVSVGIEPNNCVYFKAISEVMDLQQLCSLTSLIPTESWNKGDSRGKNNQIQKFSTLIFESNPEPDEFDVKLKKLINFLEQDEEGIKVLVEKADGYIQVEINFYIGNTMLGGPTIEKDIIKRMSNLNLEINFDLYVSGEPFN